MNSFKAIYIADTQGCIIGNDGVETDDSGRQIEVRTYPANCLQQMYHELECQYVGFLTLKTKNYVLVYDDNGFGNKPKNYLVSNLLGFDVFGHVILKYNDKDGNGVDIPNLPKPLSDQSKLNALCKKLIKVTLT